MATIRKRGNRWQAIIRRQGHPQLAKSFSTRKDCESWARKTEADIERGIYIGRNTDAGTTLAHLIDRYCRERLPELKGAEAEGYRLEALRERLGRLKLIEITTERLTKYRDQRLTMVSPASVKRELALVLRVLRIAHSEWAVVLPRGVPGVRMPKVTNARERRVSDDDIYKLLECTESLSLRLAIQFALETGMRRGEICGLQWSDVDFDARTIHIPETKTGIPRTIPMTKRCMDVLRMVDEKSALAVFGLKANSISQAFRRTARRAGLLDLHFHDLRHESITRLLEHGLSVAEVATISGHKDFRMLARYSHISSDHLLSRLEHS